MTENSNTAGPGPAGDDSASSDPTDLESTSGPSRRFLHVILILIVAVPAVAWILGFGREGEVIPLTGSEEGVDAPDFSLELFDGATFTLSRHLAENGRPVVLNFWASWCIPCREEMPAFDTVSHRRSDILVLGVAVQDTESASRAFADEVGVSYALGYDADGGVLEKYPILGLPATWFIAADGTVAQQWFGQLDETRLEELIDRHYSG